MGDYDPHGGRSASLDDDALVAAVAAMLDRVDPVPSGVAELARLSFGLRDLDHELARLVADSSLEGAGAVRSGASGAPRLLSFESGDLELELEVSSDDTTSGDTRRLLGMVLPPGPARIEVGRVDASTSVQTDGDGRFVVHGLEPGPMRLTCHRQGLASVRTPWTVLD